MQLLFWLLAFLISLGFGYWVFRADVRRAVPYPWLTAGLRTVVVFLTCLLLLAPLLNNTRNETQKPIILFLQDNSESVREALREDTGSYQDNASALLQQLATDYSVVKWGFGSSIERDTIFRYRLQGTNIANALDEAAAFYGQQNLGAIILASDGRYNEGMNPQFQNLALQGSLYAVGLGDSSSQKDARVAKVYANKTVTLKSQFEIRVDIVAEQCNGYSGTVKLSEINGETNADASVSITTDRYDRALSFTVQANKAGLHHYVISLPPAPGEANTANNRQDVFVEVVDEKKKILLAGNAPHPDINAIRAAISGVESYDLTVKTGAQIPNSFAEYDVVILHGLPSQTYPLPQLANTQKATWLIMTGGSNHTTFNTMQSLATLNVNPFNLQNQFAGYNNTFTTFTLPANINAVMDKMPPLAVPAGTVQASPNALVLFSAKSNPALPLWLLQQGKAPTALLLGEGLWRWRLFEYRHFNSHNVIDEAIRQTVAFLAANTQERPFQVVLPKYVWSDREPISLLGSLLNANNEQVNTPPVKINITDSAGRKQSYDFERSGNTYRLNIGVLAAGTYSYVSTTTYNGKTYTATGSFAVQNQPIELMETGANYALLHSLANKYDGALVPHTLVTSLADSIRKNINIKPVIRTTTETVPLVAWKWYFLLIILIATTEWLLRKYWMAQ